MKAMDAVSLATGAGVFGVLLGLGRYWSAGVVGLICVLQGFSLWRRRE